MGNVATAVRPALRRQRSLLLRLMAAPVIGHSEVDANTFRIDIVSISSGFVWNGGSTSEGLRRKAEIDTRYRGWLYWFLGHVSLPVASAYKVSLPWQLEG